MTTAEQREEVNRLLARGQITLDSRVTTTSGLTGIVRSFNEGDAVVELADGQWLDIPLCVLEPCE